jgi:hypothetical protein
MQISVAVDCALSVDLFNVNPEEIEVSLGFPRPVSTPYQTLFPVPPMTHINV